MALAWKTRALEEREVVIQDIPRPALGPIADPVSQGSTTPPPDTSTGASAFIDLITATQHDIIIRGATAWQALSTGAMGRTLMAVANAADARTAIDAEQSIAAGTTAQYWRGDKSWQTLDKTAVGLGNVTNDAQVKRTEMGAANGVATLDSGGKVPLSQINDSILGQVEYQGTWNATTNSPTLADPPASTTKGHYYVVSTAGTFAGITFGVGDWIISNGVTWDKVDNTDAVTMVAGRIGAITLTYADITDLSSWTGSAAITTLGTIATGVWDGTAIAANKGGTGQTSYTVGDLLYASATTTLSKLAAVATGQVLVSAGTGTAPAWSATPSVSSLSSAGGISASAYTAGTGGTGSAYAPLVLNGGSGTNGGGAIEFKRNSVVKGYMGNDSAINGGTSDDLAIYCIASQALKIYVNAALGFTLASTGLTLVESITTRDPNNGAGAWLLGQIRTGVALGVSTVNGLQVKVDGTLYTLAILTTNP